MRPCVAVRGVPVRGHAPASRVCGRKCRRVARTTPTGPSARRLGSQVAAVRCARARRMVRAWRTTQVPSRSVVVGVDGSPRPATAPCCGAREQAQPRAPAARRWCMPSARRWRRPGWARPPSTRPRSSRRWRTPGGAVLEEAAETVHALAPELEVYRVFDHRDPRDALLDAGPRCRGWSSSVRAGTARWRACCSARSAWRSPSTRPVPWSWCARRPDQGGGGIVVGADGTARSDAALGYAFRQAAQRALPLAIVHAFWTEQDEGYPVRIPRLRRRRPRGHAAAARRVDRRSRGRLPGGEGHPLRRARHPRQGGRCTPARPPTSSSSEPIRANALYDLMAGEVSRSVLGHARCPVAVVPDPI